MVLMFRAVGSGEAGRAELILVQNFFEDLRARFTPD
jgi:hypothetical protein